MKKNLTKQRGITLIALVITIIVLLILAGVSVAMLTGQNGILTQAQNAKNRTAEAQEEEQNRLNEYENKINQYVNDNTGTEKTPEIPNGFYHVEGTEVESGFVISTAEGDDLNNSKEGNQYVWIPVEGILGEEGKTVKNAVDGEIILGRYVFNEEGKIDTTITPTELEGEFKLSGYKYTETSTGKGNTVATDLTGFINSVRTNGGYYIARFEASKGQNGKAESKYNKPVWTDITQPESSTACQELYEGINSDLVNSYAWDTAILFIQKYGQKNYSKQHNSQTCINTGISGDVQLNIYDMASNCDEFTTETCDGPNIPCVVRGGYTTSSRGSINTGFRYPYYSFRSLLYLLP